MDVKPVMIFVILSMLLNIGVAIGINYGTVADNLPPPSTVVNLINSFPFSVNHVKIFSSDHAILNAFINEKYKFVVGVPNEDFPGFASGVSAASAWVKENISPWAKIIETVAVGNEVFLISREQLNLQLVPAMKNLKVALDQNGLKSIRVTTPVNGKVLQTYYPPSAGVFETNNGLKTVIPQLLDFLSSNGYPFMLNVYPYFGWRDHQKDNPLDYALFQQNKPQFKDQGHDYTNMFDANVDCVAAALEKAGHGDLKIVIGESGWPNAGGDGATVENARKYNQGLVDHVKVGTPKRPGLLGAYIFALFNENKKGGDSVEPHWGLLNPNGSPVYQLHE